VDNALYTEPFTVGIYYDTKKPENVNIFLQPLVLDMLLIKNQCGIFIDEKLIPVKINAFVCDAPARAFIAGKKIIQDILAVQNVYAKVTLLKIGLFF